MKLSVLLGTGLGAGYIPLVPGTIGTMEGVVFYLIFRKIFPHPLSYLLFLVVFNGIGVWVSGRCESYFKKRDASFIVIDEIGGFLITMFALPFSFRFTLLGFILFRVFDITKPFRIERIQRLPGGWGIMGDDIAAGILANVMLHIIQIMAGW
ncbi:MAG: phosphatidylglycerophosphatase A [Candidatus Aerophobetes bacterium]|nr:phosphatidylglycerophosphatase A [Candidatus Aerophobetes bacterium]